MQRFQGLFSVLAALLVFMSCASAAPRSVSVFYCTQCVKPRQNLFHWYYDVVVQVNSCYSGWRTGYKESTKSQCPAGDFSMTIDQPNDIQTKWDNSNKKLSVKYGGKWRTYKTATANRKYNNGGKDCFEWYDEYEPTTCNQ